QPWPVSAPLREAAQGQDAALVDSVAQAAIGVRRIKSDAKVSQKTPLLAVTVEAPQAQLARLEAAAADLRALGRIERLELAAGPREQLPARDAEPGQPRAKQPRSKG